MRAAATRTFDVREDARASTSTTTKRVTFVRHAEGFHNLKAALTFDTTYNSSLNFDARLTPRGEAQCRELAGVREVYDDCDLVVTSSMTRCVQTSLLAFPTLRAAPFAFDVFFMIHIASTTRVHSVELNVRSSCLTRCTDRASALHAGQELSSAHE